MSVNCFFKTPNIYHDDSFSKYLNFFTRLSNKYSDAEVIYVNTKYFRQNSILTNLAESTPEVHWTSTGEAANKVQTSSVVEARTICTRVDNCQKHTKATYWLANYKYKNQD